MATNKIPNEIYDWLGLYSYDELSARKKEQVAHTIGKERYNQYRHVVSLYQDHNNETLHQEEFSSPVWSTFIHYRIPAYQVAAFILLLWGFTSLFSNSDKLKKDHIPLHASERATPLNETNYPDKLVFNL